MSIKGDTSRPTYTTLKPDLGGRHHLLIGQGGGGDALLRLLKAIPKADSIEVLHVPESLNSLGRGDQLDISLFHKLRVFLTQATAIAALDLTLSRCTMGTRLYIAGSENFIALAEQVAMKYNLNSDEVQRQHCGSSRRRVYCIHCKASNEEVKNNIVKCTGCDRHLAVRDHYSRRLGAYMGVMADAESPGELPTIREVFS